jgi:ribosome-binding factor A
MAKRKQPGRDLCAQWHEDDGVNPRQERKTAPRRSSRKDLQFCSQVAAALSAALQGEAASPLLRECLVERAEPAPDTSRLRVFVSGPALRQFGVGRVLEELGRARGFLRLQVGAAIARKRVPELIFCATPDEEGHND